MEGQPDVEPKNQDKMDRNGELAEDELKNWQRGQVRNTLHLVSAAAQWILLLACLIYLGIHSLQPSTSQSDEVPWTHIRYTGKSIKGVAVNLTALLGSIPIKNGSIMITCDGLYVVSLKGDVEPVDPSPLNLTLLKTHNKDNQALWEQTVQDKSTAVNLTTVLFFFTQDSITLWTSSNATINDLTFTFVLIKSPLPC